VGARHVVLWVGDRLRLAWAVAFAAVAYTVAYAILMAILWLYERRPIRRWLKREGTPVQEELLD